MSDSIKPKRGEIWRVDLEPTIGREIQSDKGKKGDTRPVLILSRSGVGEASVKLCAPITDFKLPRDALRYWRVAIGDSKESGLTKMSCANLSQTRALDVARFVRKDGVAHEAEIEAAASALAFELVPSWRDNQRCKTALSLMITAQDIGVLAMIGKLTRIWVPEGTPRKNIHIGMDGTWHRQLLDKFLVEQDARMTALYSGSGVSYQDDQLTRRLRNDRSSCLRFSVDIGDEACFSYHERGNWWELCSTETFPSDEEEPGYKFYGYMGLLRIWDDDELGEFFDAGHSPDPTRPYSSAKRTEFSKHWLPYFRRNCWLCGCDIKRSREEREEWMQGFTA